MESKTIKDNYISASTALASNPVSNARLNSGSYNSNSWCASRIDNSQYLEVRNFKLDSCKFGVNSHVFITFMSKS